MMGSRIRMASLLLAVSYLLNRCQEDFERGWFAKEAAGAAAAAKAADYHATKTARKEMGMEEAELYFDKYYAAEKAQRQGLSLIKFIGELFKLQMLTDRIMHECVKKLLGNVENPEEEEIESLCQLLKTVGQLLDTPKARVHIDVYFTRMKELGKSFNVSSRMQFTLQLRDRKWVSRNAVTAPTVIVAIHELAAKQKAGVQKESFNRQISTSRGGDRNQEHGPDCWAVAGASVPQFGKITKGPAIGMVMSPSGVFAASMKDSKREELLRANSSSNMFHMLSQNPELAAEASAKPSRSSSRKSSIDLGYAGIPKPAVQRRQLQILPRSILVAEDRTMTPLEDERESVPITMSKADVKKEIDRCVEEFFVVRNIEEADVYFTDLPHELCFRLVDNRQIRTSGGGPRPGGERNIEHGPDG
ncbi:armadillo-type protein [Suillus lakei]|nr:armadillo-type protein [Suillus lakei]